MRKLSRGVKMSSFQFQADMYNSVSSNDTTEELKALKTRVSILENQMADLLRQDNTDNISKTCINCIHKDVCYLYRLNFIIAEEGYCSHYNGGIQ